MYLCQSSVAGTMFEQKYIYIYVQNVNTIKN